MAATGVGYALLGPRGKRRDADGRVVIDYWEKWTGHEGEAMLDIVERFNRAQDRILVRYFATSSIDQKAMVAIAGNDPPDVLGLWSYSLPAFAESQAIMELPQLTSDYGLDSRHYATSIWQLMQHDGRRYAAVNTCGNTALYYDRRLFADAGLDPDRPPRTIAELDAYAEALTSYRDDGSIERAGFLHSEPGWWSWGWGHYFGGRLFQPLTNTVLAASEENLRAYAWVQSYPQEYGFDQLERLRSTFGNYMSAQQSFLTGRLAMLMQGPWLASVINSFAPQLDYAAASFPTEAGVGEPEQAVTCLESDLLVVPRGARHAQEAIEFIAFTQRRENVEHLSHLHAKPSPLREVSPAFLTDHPNRAVEQHTAMLQSPAAFVVPRIRSWPQYRDEFVSGMDRLWSLAEPYDRVLTTVQQRVQQHVDHAAQRRLQRSAKRGRVS